MSLSSANRVVYQGYQSLTQRAALNVTLKEKIIHEDPQSEWNVCTRFLRIDSINTADVERCVDSLWLERSVDIAELERLAKEALGKDVEVLERGDAEERLMYQPLVRIFNHIANFPFSSTSIHIESVDNLATGGSHELDSSNNARNRNDEDAKPDTKNVKNADVATRVFRVTRGMLKADTPQEFGFCQANPDISANDKTKNTTKYWRDADVFVEVKPSAKQGPKSAKGSMIPSLVTQSADYARLYLAARPFMLYSIGILVFGTNFCVGVFDRDGITFSPIYDMFGSDISILVRVIYSISRLPIEDLGFDPTVEMLDPKTQQELDISGSCGGAHNACPSYLVTASTTPDDRRRWCTIGPPVWSSTSLLGKGTTVWHAKEYIPSTKTLSGPQVILKTSWRHNLKPKESDIYRHVHTELSRMRPNDVTNSRIAQWVCGGDVLFPATTFPISVDNLRHPERSRRAVDAPEYRNGKWKPTSTMHRLVLSSVGKLLTKYSSEKELLEAFRDALQGHKNLCDVGVLHRDISIGNIFIGENGGGFVGDLDYACIRAEKISQASTTGNSVVGHGIKTAGRRKNRAASSFRVTVPSAQFEILRGIKITETVQFMAFELLVPYQHKGPHDVHHDIESFIWVLCCAVLTGLMDRLKTMEASIENYQLVKKAFETLLAESFSQPAPRRIADQRTPFSDTIIFPQVEPYCYIVPHLMSPHLIDLFSKLADLLYRNKRLSPNPLDHKCVLDVVDEALSGINAEMMNVDAELLV